MNKRKPRVALMSYPMDNRHGMGTGVYTRRLIENLLADGRFEFSLVHYQHEDDPLYTKEREIMMPDIKLPFGTRFVRQMLFFWKYRNDQFDIIHWFQPRLYPFFWLAPAEHRVATLHGAGDITAPGKFPFSRRMFNFVLTHFNRYLDVIIAVSEYGRQEIIQWYRADPEHVYVTYPGGGERFVRVPKEEAIRSVRERFDIPGGFILDVSHLEPHKNVERVIRAYLTIREKGVTQKLVIVGKGRHHYDALRALASSTGRGDDVVFIPYALEEELNALYVAADLFVFPSLNEGFGLPLVEAMSMGTPIVTSNTTALPEIVGDAAITVDPTSVEAIAQAMQRVLTDSTLRDELVQKGLARAQVFTWAETARKTLELYKTVMSTSVANR